jgi:Bax protein
MLKTLTRPTNLIFPLSYKVGLVKLIKKSSSRYNSFFKTFILSLVLIFCFFSLPSTFGFFIQTDKDSNTPRLSENTKVQLFKDKKNNLKEIRKTKLVNISNSINRLPKQIKNIENVKERKKLFIQIVLPLIIEENIKIRLDRKKLFSILNKNNNSIIEKKWLDNKFKEYEVKDNSLSVLKIRMDEIPVSLAIAQAATETGWGTSRFAQEGNALFGQWTWSGDGIRPVAADSNSTHKVRKFKVLRASVRAYQKNLNTHSSYFDFRKKRAIQRDNNNKLNSLELVKYLVKYAETGIEYTKNLKKIIQQNSLTELDNVNILTRSNKIRSLI